MVWLLDTNILIAINKKNPLVLSRLAKVDYRSIILSSVVVAEIEYGIAKSARYDSNRKLFDVLISRFAMLHFDGRAAKAFGRLRADLERRGSVIGPYDMMIAAHALALEATLVTDNIREFERVEGLKLDNWLR